MGGHPLQGSLHPHRRKASHGSSLKPGLAANKQICRQPTAPYEGKGQNQSRDACSGTSYRVLFKRIGAKREKDLRPLGKLTPPPQSCTGSEGAHHDTKFLQHGVVHQLGHFARPGGHCIGDVTRHPGCPNIPVSSGFHPDLGTCNLA